MSDAQFLYLILGLQGCQLVLFMLAMAYQLSSGQKPAAGWKANVLSGIGFLVMAASAFLVEHYVPASQAWYTWLAGCGFVLFGSFLLWVGVTRRRLLARGNANKNN